MPNENTLPTPETRHEMFLASAAGMNVALPDPVTREEMFLDAIAKGGGVSPDDAYTKAQTDALLANKVDKETGKGLSTEDFTAAEKTKLSGIEAGAEVNVQANWTQASSSADDFIKNKPTLGTAAAADMTTSIASGGAGLPTAGTVYTDQQRQEAEIGAVANAGAKNLFKNTASSSTNVTVNSDGTVIVDTAGEELTANLSKTIGSFSGVSGEKYILSGCPSGGSSSTWRITLSGVAYEYGDGVEFTADGQAHDVIVWVKSGQTVSDLVFKPMIRSASITDSTFVPYAPTNRELYEMILAMQNGG